MYPRLYTERMDEIKAVNLDGIADQLADPNTSFYEGSHGDLHLRLIDLATIQGRVDILRNEIKRGADYTKPIVKDFFNHLQLGYIFKHTTLIFIAAMHNQTEIARVLIDEFGVDFQSVLVDGYHIGATPIYIAASEGHADIMRLLIERGADFQSALIGVRNPGYTPIYTAVENGRIDVVRLLVDEYHVDFKSALTGGAKKGFTLIYVAAYKNHINVVQLLIERGADFQTALTDGRDKGLTPLDAAVRSNLDGVARFFLERGANQPSMAFLREAADDGCFQAVRTVLMYRMKEFLLENPPLLSRAFNDSFFGHQLKVIKEALAKSTSAVISFYIAMASSSTLNTLLPIEVLLRIAYFDFLSSAKCSVSLECFVSIALQDQLVDSYNAITVLHANKKVTYDPQTNLFASHSESTKNVEESGDSKKRKRGEDEGEDAELRVAKRARPES